MTYEHVWIVMSALSCTVEPPPYVYWLVMGSIDGSHCKSINLTREEALSKAQKLIDQFGGTVRILERKSNDVG